MVKDKKIQCKTWNVNKISFMHYIKLTRIMSPVVFEEFKLVYVFFPIFFSISFKIGNRSTLAKILGGRNPSAPHFLRVWVTLGYNNFRIRYFILQRYNNSKSIKDFLYYQISEISKFSQNSRSKVFMIESWSENLSLTKNKKMIGTIQNVDHHGYWY